MAFEKRTGEPRASVLPDASQDMAILECNCCCAAAAPVLFIFS